MSKDTETVSLLIDAGEAKPSGSIAPALGPLGLNLGKVVADINQATKDFKGMKVPVDIVVDTSTRKYIIEVGLPPTSALVLNQINLPKGSGQTGHEVVGNLTYDQVISVAQAKRPDLLAATLGAATREVLGTMVTMGITCDGLDAREVQKKTLAGEYEEILSKYGN